MNAAELLRDRGIQPSFQRTRIYEILAATRSHPSADSIHTVLASEIATLSRTTVYNTLDLFVRSGLAQRLTVSGTELRFDADMAPHAHFRCRVCRIVVDLPEVYLKAALPLPEGFIVETVQVHAEGLCAGCASAAL